MNTKRYRYWTGDEIGVPDPVIHKNVILVFGSNPCGWNSKGVALTAKLHWGAGYGIGRGRGRVGQAYALVTKNLKKDFVEPATGIHYARYGKFSVPKEMIRANVVEMYEYCLAHPELSFVVPYKRSKDNLNGYSSEEIFRIMTVGLDVPPNVVFHESFKGFS